MKKYIYVLRDKKLGAYLIPEFKNDDKEHYVEGTIRGLTLIDPSHVSRARDMALYYFGIYDDLDGKFELLKDPEKLLDYEDFVPKKEGSHVGS